MSYPNEDIEYCPTRANIDWSNIQFTDYSKGVAVADFSNIKYFEPSDSEAEAEEEDQGEEEDNGQQRAEASGDREENEDDRPLPRQSPLSKKARQKAKKKAKAAAKAVKLDEDDGEGSKDPETPISPPVEDEEDDKPSGKKGKGKSKKGKKSAKKNAKSSSNSRSVPQDEASSSQKPPAAEPKAEEITTEKPVEASTNEEPKPEPVEKSREENSQPPPAAEEAQSSDPAPQDSPESDPPKADNEAVREIEGESNPEEAPPPAAPQEPESTGESPPETVSSNDQPAQDEPISEPVQESTSSEPAAEKEQEQEQEPEAKNDDPPTPIGEVVKDGTPPEEPKAEEPEPQKAEEPEPELEQAEEQSAPTSSQDPIAAESQDGPSVLEPKDEPSSPADQPEPPSTENEVEATPAEPEVSDVKDTAEDLAPAAEPQAEETKDERAPAEPEVDSGPPQGEEPNAEVNDAVEEVNDEPQPVAETDSATEPDHVEPETVDSDEKNLEEASPSSEVQIQEATDGEETETPTAPAPEGQQAAEADSKPAEAEDSKTQEDATEPPTIPDESPQAEEVAGSSDPDSKPEDSQEESPENGGDKEGLEKEATAEDQAPAESEASVPVSDTKNTVDGLDQNASQAAPGNASEDDASKPEAQPDDAGDNASPVEPEISESKDDCSSEPVGAEVETKPEADENQQSEAEENNPATETQNEEEQAQVALDLGESSTQEAEIEKPSEADEVQKPSENESSADEAPSAPVEDAEQTADVPSDEPSKTDESLPTDKISGENETSEESADLAQAPVLDSNSEEKEKGAETETEGSPDEAPEAPQPSITEEDSEKSPDDSPSDPVESDEAVPSNAQSNDEPQPQDVTIIDAQIDDTEKDNSSELKPAEESIAAAEPQVDSPQDAEGSQEPTANPEASTIAGDESNDVAEPESPSAKQVRFADNPEVITAPLSRDGGSPPPEEQKESPANDDDAPEESTPLDGSESGAKSAPSPELTENKPSDDPSSEPPSTEAESSDEAKSDEPQQIDNATDEEIQKSEAAPEDSKDEEPESAPAEPEIEAPAEPEESETVGVTIASKDIETSAVDEDSPQVGEPLQSEPETDQEAKEDNAESSDSRPPESSEDISVSENDAASSNVDEEPNPPSDELPGSKDVVEAPGSQETETKDDATEGPSSGPVDSEPGADEASVNLDNVEKKSQSQDEQIAPATQPDDAEPPATEAASESPKDANPAANDSKATDPPSTETLETQDESPHEEVVAESNTENEQPSLVQEPEGDLEKPEEDNKDEPEPESVKQDTKGETEAEPIKEDSPIPEIDQASGDPEDSGANVAEPTEQPEVSAEDKQPTTSGEPAAVDEAETEAKDAVDEPQASPADDNKVDEPEAPEEPISQEAEDTVPVAVDDEAASENVRDSEPKIESKETEEETDPVAVQEPAKVDDTPPAPPGSDKEPKPEDDESKDTLGPIPSAEKAEKTDKGEDHPAFYSHDTPGVGGNFVSNPIEESLLAEDMDDGGAKMNITEDNRPASDGSTALRNDQSPPDEDDGGVQFAAEPAATAADRDILYSDDNMASKHAVEDDEVVLQELGHLGVESIPMKDVEAPGTSTLPEEQESPLVDDDNESTNIVQNEDTSQAGGSTPLGTEGSGGVPLSNLPMEEDSSDHGINLKDDDSSLNEFNTDPLQLDAPRGLEAHLPTQMGHDESDDTHHAQKGEGATLEEDPVASQPEAALPKAEANEQAQHGVSVPDTVGDTQETSDIVMPSSMPDNPPAQMHANVELNDANIKSEGTLADTAQEDSTDGVAGLGQATPASLAEDENRNNAAGITIDHPEIISVPEDKVLGEETQRIREETEEKPAIIEPSSMESQDATILQDSGQQLPSIMPTESQEQNALEQDANQERASTPASPTIQQTHDEDAVVETTLNSLSQASESREPLPHQNVATVVNASGLNEINPDGLTSEPSTTETAHVRVDLSDAEPVQGPVESAHQESTATDAPSSNLNEALTDSLDNQEPFTPLINEPVLPHQVLPSAEQDVSQLPTLDDSSISVSREALELHGEDQVQLSELPPEESKDNSSSPRITIETEETQGDAGLTKSVEPTDDDEATVDLNAVQGEQSTSQEANNAEAVLPINDVKPELETQEEQPSDSISDDFVLVEKDEVEPSESSANVEVPLISRKLPQPESPLADAAQFDLDTPDDIKNNQAVTAEPSIEDDISSLAGMPTADVPVQAATQAEAVMAPQSIDDSSSDDNQGALQSELVGETGNLRETGDQDASDLSHGNPDKNQSPQHEGLVENHLAENLGQLSGLGPEETSVAQLPTSVIENESSSKDPSSEHIFEGREPTRIQEAAVPGDLDPSHGSPGDAPEHILESENTAALPVTEPESSFSNSHATTGEATSGEDQPQALESVDNNSVEDTGATIPEAVPNDTIKENHPENVVEVLSPIDHQPVESVTDPEDLQSVPQFAEVAGHTVSEEPVPGENVTESKSEILVKEVLEDTDKPISDAEESPVDSSPDEGITSEQLEPSQEIHETVVAPSSNPLDSLSTEGASITEPIITATADTEEQAPVSAVIPAENDLPGFDAPKIKESVVIETPQVENVPNLGSSEFSSPRIENMAIDRAELSAVPELDVTAGNESHQLSDSIGQDEVVQPISLPEQDVPVDSSELVSNEDIRALPTTPVVSGLVDKCEQDEVSEPQSGNLLTEDAIGDTAALPQPSSEDVSEALAQDETRSILDSGADDPTILATDGNEAMPPSPHPSPENKATTPASDTQVLEDVDESITLGTREEVRGNTTEPDGSVEPILLAASVEPETRDISESGLDSVNENLVKESQIGHTAVMAGEILPDFHDPPDSSVKDDLLEDVNTPEVLQSETVAQSDSQDDIKLTAEDDGLQDCLEATAESLPLSSGVGFGDSRRDIAPLVESQSEGHISGPPRESLIEDTICEPSTVPDPTSEHIVFDTRETLAGEVAGDNMEAPTFTPDQGQIAESMSRQSSDKGDLEPIPMEESNEPLLTSAHTSEELPTETRIAPEPLVLESLSQISSPQVSPSPTPIIANQSSAISEGVKVSDNDAPLNLSEETSAIRQYSSTPPPESSTTHDKYLTSQEPSGQELNLDTTELREMPGDESKSQVSDHQSVTTQATFPESVIDQQHLQVNDTSHSISALVDEDSSLASKSHSMENQNTLEAEIQNTTDESGRKRLPSEDIEGPSPVFPAAVLAMSEDIKPPLPIISNEAESQPSVQEELTQSIQDQAIAEMEGEHPQVSTLGDDTPAANSQEHEEASIKETPVAEPSPLEPVDVVESTEQPTEIVSQQSRPVLEESLSEQQEACPADALPMTEAIHEFQQYIPFDESPDILRSHEQEPEAETSKLSLFSPDYTVEDLQAEPAVTPPPVEAVRELISTVLDNYREEEQPRRIDSEGSAGTHPDSTIPGHPMVQEETIVETAAAESVPEISHERAIVPESPILPSTAVYEDDHDSHMEEPSHVVETVASQEVPSIALPDDNITAKVLEGLPENGPGTSNADEPQPSDRELVAEDIAPSSPPIGTKDFGQIPELAAVEPQSHELPSQIPTDDIKSTSSAEPDPAHVVDEHVPLSESFTIVDEPSSTDHERQSRPEMPRIDSGTQTEDLFRPKTPLQMLMKNAMSQEFRAPTPAIEIPDAEDPHAKQLSRARSVRRKRRQTIRDAEELVAAAVVIYAAAEALSPPGSPPLASNLEKELAKEEEPVVLSLSDSTAQGAVVENSIGEEDALRKSVADLLAEDKSRELKSDEKSPKSSRSSHRSSHHSSRSTRSRDGSKDTAAKVPHHHHHKRRADSEHSARSGSEQGSPRTPKRQDSGFSSSHSARSKKERTPEEQAAHDKRKERRLAREKERLNDSSPSKSPSKSSKGKEPETEKSSSHRSSRRHSHASATVTKEDSPVPPPKKFFDMKNGQSVLQSNFGPREGSVDKEIARPEIPQRSNTTRSAKGGVRKSVDASRAKLQKTRDEGSEDAKEATAAESSDAGPGDAPAAGDEHRKNRQERRQKEGGKDHSKPGFRAVIKRFFTS